MHPADCPSWEYENHAHRATVLPREGRAALTALRNGALDTLAAARDTRPVHERLFGRLTPAGYSYFAGHYRGETFRCLLHYTVQIPADARVGHNPASVPLVMDDHFGRAVETAVAALDQGSSLPNSTLAQNQKLLYTVAAACKLFVEFLTIHPYANGNGHAARFLVWAILGRYGYWPHRWPLDPRPREPTYSDAIKLHRDGDPEPLERFVLSCLMP